MKIVMLVWSVVVLAVAGCAGEVRPSAGGVGPSAPGGVRQLAGSATVAKASGTQAASPAVPVRVAPGVAMLVPADEAGADDAASWPGRAGPALVPLEPAPRLVTPAATVTVGAAGGWGLGGSDGGLVTRVWRVTVAAPPALAPPGDPFSVGAGPDLPPRDAATTLWLEAGSERLPVLRDGQPAAARERPTVAPPDPATAAERLPVLRDGDPAVIRCDELPCGDRPAADHLLIATVPADAEPAIVATVDGVDQRLDLRTGEVTSSVSRVAYDRPSVVPATVPAWPPRTLAVRTQAQLEAEFGTGAGDLTRGGLDVGYGGRIAEIYLAPFDRFEGWAPPGHAWLVIRVEGHLRQPANTSWRARLDAAASWTVAHDAGVATPAYPPTPDDVLAFLVPDDVGSVTLAYRPTGTVVLPPDAAHHEFRAPEPLTVEVPLP